MAFSRELPDSFHEALIVARRILSANHDLVVKGLVEREAELIVMEAYRSTLPKRSLFTRMDLFSRAKDRFPEAAGEKVILWAISRAEGKILQHLTGVQVFLDHEYQVSSDVLVPRPETEILVLSAFDELAKAGGSPKLGLEVGLGSGILSISFLSRFPELKMIATEISPPAANLARINANTILGELGSSRLEIELVSSGQEVLEPLVQRMDASPKADFLVSNPPYLVSSDEIEADVRQFEPGLALFAPENDPIYFYRKIAAQARSVLKPGGWVFLELHAQRAMVIAELFSDNDWTVSLVKDLNQSERVLLAKLNLA